MYYDGPHNGFDWGWGLFACLVWIVVLVVFFYTILRLLNHYEKSDGQFHKVSSDPLSIAKQRLAKGEIDKHEYEELLKHLSK